MLLKLKYILLILEYREDNIRRTHSGGDEAPPTEEIPGEYAGDLAPRVRFPNERIAELVSTYHELSNAVIGSCKQCRQFKISNGFN